MSARGRFVVLEGGEGSGKSTQVQRLAAHLESIGIPSICTFEPGATVLGAAIRSWVLDQGVDPRSEALLMAADRAHHITTVVAPALASGTWVISDRHVPSSLAYQGVARGLGVTPVAALSAFAVGDLSPDVVIVLDIDEATANERVPDPTDAMEAVGAEFHRQVRQAYRDLAPQHGWNIIDATQSPERVSEMVWELVEGLR